MERLVLSVEKNEGRLVKRGSSGIRVLHVIPSIAKSCGGPSRAVFEIDRELSALGVSVTILTTDHEIEDAYGSAAETRSSASNRIVMPLTTLPYKTSFRMWAWLRDNVSSFDVVHVHGLFSFAPVAAAWWAKRRGVPYVIRPLGVLNRYGMESRRWSKRVSVWLFEGPLLEAAAAIQFTAIAERDEAIEAVGPKSASAIIPLGIESSAPAPRSMIEERYPTLRGHGYILFMSRVDPKKNLEGLFEALTLANASVRERQLVICGSGKDEYLKYLKQLSQSFGVDNRIIWAGHVDGEAKVAFLQHADLFVLPSYSENFGIAAAEAMANGCPVVLGEGVALSKDASDSSAALVCTTEARSIADAMEGMLSDPVFASRVALNARHMMREKFSPGIMAKRLLDLYRAITRSDA